MIEISIHGRGGQGAVTAAQILAEAAFLQDYWAQSFPKFGGERRGAPVVAYVRYDHEPIPIRSNVYSPDVVMVMDFNLFKMLNPVDDLKTGGMAILNYPDQGPEIPQSLVEKAGSLYTVDATSIAHRIYGRTTIPITNVVILGAYCAAREEVALESVIKILPNYFSEEKLEANVKAAEMGFRHLRGVSWPSQ